MGVYVLELGASVEVYVLFREQLNGHVVYGLYFLLEYYGLEQCVHATVPLLISVLCY